MPHHPRHWRHPVIIVVVLLAGALRLPHEVDEGHGLLLVARATAPDPGRDAQEPPCRVDPEQVVARRCPQPATPTPFDLFDPDRFPLYAAADRTPPQE